MTEDQIKHMVDRFLWWRLPEHFNPDCGIQFDADGAIKLDPRNHKYEPVGTNLFCADQATAMVRHMIEDLPTPAPAAAARDQKATAAAIWNEVGETARRYARCYEQGSDGRNTFIMFAEWADGKANAETRPSDSGECPPPAVLADRAQTADEALEAMSKCDYWNGRKSLSDPVLGAYERCAKLAESFSRGAFTGWKGKTGESKITLDAAEEHSSECFLELRDAIRALQPQPYLSNGIPCENQSSVHVELPELLSGDCKIHHANDSNEPTSHYQAQPL